MASLAVRVVCGDLIFFFVFNSAGSSAKNSQKTNELKCEKIKAKMKTRINRCIEKIISIISLSSSKLAPQPEHVIKI